ncbi:MAG: glycosyltransferase family 4 protein [Acidimicrobiales bacterium]|nr:glycosyltransferase family 4 protein [Acidimicrobiales bacterium]
MSAPDGPLRIALLSYRGKPHCGGQGVYTRHLSKALADVGHHVEVFSGQPYPVLDDRVTLHRLPSLDIFNEHFPGRMPAFWEIKTLPDAAELLTFCTGTFPEPLAFTLRAYQHVKQRPGEFDLVHDNQSLGYGLIGIQRLGVPVIATIHHPITVDRRLEQDHAPNWRKRFSVGRWYGFTAMQSRVAQRVPKVITVSENSQADIHRDHGVPLDRMAVVPVGVDPDLFRPLPHVERRPGRIITTASADVTMKGLVYLLEALAKIRTEHEHADLVVIGRPKEEGKAARTIERLGLEPVVHFVSGVSDERIVELYAEAEVAVVPSLYEGFSLPAIEAMCCAVPLIATSGGALPEVVGADGDTALVVPPGDSDALAASLRRAFADPALRERVGHNGRQRVIDRWSWRVTAERTVAQYRELLALPNPCGTPAGAR